MAMPLPSPEPEPHAEPSRGRVWERLARSPRAEGWGAAVFGALMVVLAVPTWNLALPIVVALVPALVLARSRPWRARFRLGWLMGFLFHMVLFRWIPFTVTEMTPIPLPVAWGMWLLYAAWHGMALGVFLALSEPVRRATAARAPALQLVAVALAFVVVEWAWPVIFPWSLGHAFWQVGPVAAIQAFFGVPGLAFFTLLLNAGLAELWLGRRAASPRAAPAESRRAVYVAAGTLAVLLALGFGWYLHASGADASRTLRVAILQPNWTLAEKKHATPEQRKKLLGRLDADLRKIPRDRYDLVVASEGTFPLLWRVDADTAPADDAQVAATRVIARAIAEGPHTEAIIGGLRAGDVLDPAAAAASPTARAPRPPARKTHNSAVHLAADGRIVDHYDKRVLVPFSEYLPFSDLIPALKNAVSGIGNFDPGTTSCRFVVAGVPMGCGICYETMFADEMRASVGDDARVLLNLTIDTWFGKTVAPEMHLMAHASRAVELGIPLVRAALTGISALVSPTGEVVASMPVDGEGVLAVDVPITDLATPYRAIGPVFAWVAAALVVVALAEAFRRRRELFPPRVVKPTVDA